MKRSTPSPERNSLQGHHILFLSLPKHDAHYTSTPWQIASQLAATNTVYFADHPFTFPDLITGFFKPAIRRRIKAYFSNPFYRKNGIYVILSPFVFPINFLPRGRIYDLFSSLNQRMLARRINASLRANSAAALVYVNSFNFYFPDMPRYLHFKPSLNVYHCIDPMVKAFTLRHGLYLQERAARNADMIVATAPSLQKQFERPGYPKSYLVPNAADFKLFNRAVHEQTIHSKVQDIPGKVMGYLGNIERRTDFGLLKRVLEILPDWHIVLAGPVERQYVPGEIFDHQRIHFIGPVPHQQAPEAIRRFDVAIIPFKSDEVSRGIYPLKLFEYLAAGKPVVSTNFNPDILRDVADVVHCSENETQFADLVLLAYATDSTEKRDQRIAVASLNTWDKRAQLFSQYVRQELDAKTRMKYVA